ncbi:hypothetical protein R3P38DRAFT_2858811 [Favolaschia claudopus]|uniref:Secreted protein n=1 Tax=Favolaschia claudopus TaxID=2862362 RepID=A0AAW0DH59_9AGAR
MFSNTASPFFRLALALLSLQETHLARKCTFAHTSLLLRLRLTQRCFPDRPAVGCLIPMIRIIFVSDTLAEVSITPSPTYNGHYPGYLPASRYGGGNDASRDLLLETSAKCCIH